MIDPDSNDAHEISDTLTVRVDDLGGVHIDHDDPNRDRLSISPHAFESIMSKWAIKMETKNNDDTTDPNNGTNENL